MLELDGAPLVAAGSIPVAAQLPDQDVLVLHRDGPDRPLNELRAASIVDASDALVGTVQTTEALSGTPVWSLSEDTIAALMVMSPSPSGGAVLNAVPAADILATFTKHNLEHWLAPRDNDSVRSKLIHILAESFSDLHQRREMNLALAQTLGIAPAQDDLASSLNALADLLLTHERGLPTLIDTLTTRDGSHSPDTVRRLLSIARIAPHHLLLSASEFDRLLALLTPLVEADPGLLRQASHQALPYATQPQFPDGEFTDDYSLPDTVRHWEALSGDGHLPDGPDLRMPALLRVVEYMAAVVDGEPKEQLHRWGEDVAARLRLPRAALAERRVDAEQWALRYVGTDRETAPGNSRRLRMYTPAAGLRLHIGAYIATESALYRLQGSSTVREVTCTGAIGNLRLLATLPALRTLVIDANPLLESLVDLRGCEKLRSLRLAGCDGLRDLSSLDATGVMSLELEQQEIRVAVLRTLAAVRWLRELRLSGLPQDGTLEEVLATLPGVKLEVWE
ncbi:hypothetical protein [Streptomyces sp. NPDC005732]|uniref:hypothetical protein n=1 Tax=Streptomyces sp. NPDC005732 TaxID=3157057 RepID=UPI0033EF41DE